MPIIGLTGGIASGKSTVAELLQEKGARIVDADVIAREIVEPGSTALDQIRRRFGASILNPDGSLNRAELAKRIFADPACRQDLNAIMHPRIFAAIASQIAAERRDKVVVVEAALLAETWDRAARLLGMEALVVVDTSRELQIERARRSRGMSAAEAQARIAAQADRAERRALADYVIDNSGTLDDLKSRVDRVWTRLVAASTEPD